MLKRGIKKRCPNCGALLSDEGCQFCGYQESGSQSKIKEAPVNLPAAPTAPPRPAPAKTKKSSGRSGMPLWLAIIIVITIPILRSGLLQSEQFQEPNADKISITLPQTPFDVGYKIVYASRTETVNAATITAISEERFDDRFDGVAFVRVKFTISGIKTYDRDGANGIGTVDMQFVIKNDAGDIIVTWKLQARDTYVDQTFEIECGYDFYSNGSYTIEIGYYEY